MDYGLNITDEEFNELCIIFDKDGSGSISFDEFMIAIRVSIRQLLFDNSVQTRS